MDKVIDTAIATVITFLLLFLPVFLLIDKIISRLYVMLCAIWYHFYNLRNVKNIHGRVLLLVKLQAEPTTLLKVTFLHGCFSHFSNCIKGTKLNRSSHIVRTLTILCMLYVCLLCWCHNQLKIKDKLK